MELQTLERTGRKLVAHAGCRDALILYAGILLSLATSHPIRAGIWLSFALSGVGVLLMTIAAGTIMGGDEKAANLKKLEVIGQFLILAAISTGCASFVGVLFAVAATLGRFAQNRESVKDRLNVSLSGIGPWFSSRFSVTWAIWRGTKPIGGQLVLLGVALTTLWVYVFIPRLSFGTAQGLLVNLALGIVVIVRIATKSGVYSDPSKRSTYP